MTMPFTIDDLASIDRDAVLAAIAKCDELGRQKFLSEHGYTRARTYVLMHEGKSYDAKAILGVAYGIAHPEQGHLGGKDFHSGTATVQRPLERLGFQVLAERGHRKPAQTEQKQGEEAIDASRHAGEPKYGILNLAEEGCFVPDDDIRKMVAALRVKKNLILQGPPGTGKTWLAKRLGFLLRQTDSLDETLRIVQFHPSLSYEDFVRGYRPGAEATLELTDGVLLEMVAAARADSAHHYVLVIEEINRGNPAQIFGEMLTLLENTKRTDGEALELAYKRQPGERVFIPENLYVIGTMNIADRSLALVDLALRRRFAFFTLNPQLNDRWLAWCRDQRGLTDVELRAIRTRMEDVNQAIADDRSLGAQFQLGHSFVTPTTPIAEGEGWTWFQQVVETEIHPLLSEYWFDQLSKADDARRDLLAPLRA